MKKLLVFAAFAATLAIGATPAFADTDGDGWEPPIDCNDNNSMIHPAATEIAGDSVDQDCDNQEICYRNFDHDSARSTVTQGSADSDCFDIGEGRASDPIDCNDSDSLTYPGAPETVGDENDQDCDGVETCYGDGDNDGARTSSTQPSSDTDCADAFEGRATDPDDCDDLDPAISPFASEICDPSDIDEDCDGLADDADTAVSGTTPWYEDSDDDGYGDASSALPRCDQPIGYVGNDDDCDDADASISPGDPEICDAANEDEDCDGLADDSDTAVGGTTPWYADVDGDGYGATGSPPEILCDAPASHVGNDGDCDDTDDGVNPGATESCEAGDPEDYNCDGNAACDDPSCAMAPDCSAQVFDHMECFKVKSSDKIRATIDANPGTAPPFQLAEGCTVGKAAKVCVPIMRPAYTVDASSTVVENPLYEGPSMETMSICYKVKCPSDSPPIGSQPTVELLDHFGNREFEKFKVKEICAPAELVP